MNTPMHNFMPKLERSIMSVLLACVLCIFSIISSVSASKHAAFVLSDPLAAFTICGVDADGKPTSPTSKHSDCPCAILCAAAQSLNVLGEVPHVFSFITLTQFSNTLQFLYNDAQNAPPALTHEFSARAPPALLI